MCLSTQNLVITWLGYLWEGIQAGAEIGYKIPALLFVAAGISLKQRIYTGICIWFCLPAFD